MHEPGSPQSTSRTEISDDGLSNRDRIGIVESPSGDVEMLLDRVQRGQGPPIWLFSSSTLQEIPRLYDEIQPPWIERYMPEWLRANRWLSLPLYRWIAILLLIPLFFGLAALSTRGLTRCAQSVVPPPHAGAERPQGAKRGAVALAGSRPVFLQRVVSESHARHAALLESCGRDVDGPGPQLARDTPAGCRGES